MRAATSGSSANNSTPTRRSSSNITQPAISAAPTNTNPSRSGRNTASLDELAHDEGRRNHLERQVEDVQHVGQQAGVVVLLEFHVHPLGRHVLAAVVPVGLPEADAEPFCLVQLGGGQQEQHLAVDTWLGSATAQVPHERRRSIAVLRADGVCLQTCRRTPRGSPGVDSAGRPRRRVSPDRSR